MQILIQTQGLCINTEQEIEEILESIKEGLAHRKSDYHRSGESISLSTTALNIDINCEVIF